MFEVCSTICETFVFAYLGMSVFSIPHDWDLALCGLSAVGIFIARAMQVFPLSWAINGVRKLAGSGLRITWRHQVMLWFAGLRGAMAFALSMDVPIASGELIRTSTLFLCILTVLLLGSSTGKMLQLLDIDMHLDPRLASNDAAEETRDSKLLRIDQRYLKPFFTRDAPRSRSQVLPETRDLEENELVEWKRTDDKSTAASQNSTDVEAELSTGPSSSNEPPSPSPELMEQEARSISLSGGESKTAVFRSSNNSSADFE